MLYYSDVGKNDDILIILFDILCDITSCLIFLSYFLYVSKEVSSLLFSMTIAHCCKVK